jgi:hemolysin activation/secretion protein
LKGLLQSGDPERRMKALQQTWKAGCILLWVLLGQNSLSGAVDTNLAYTVSRFVVEYGPLGGQPHPGLPPLEELLATEIVIGQADDLYVPPQGATATSVITLGAIRTPTRFSGQSLIWIDNVLANSVKRHGVVAVWAAPYSGDIDPESGQDLRTDRDALRILVYVGEVEQVRTVAKGSRIPMDRALNNPVHRRILENSPLQGAEDGKRGSLLHTKPLDDYVGRLNRFPGRGVEAAISSSGKPNGVILDYLVSEDKPWVVYAQVANTGTEDSGEWRVHFGFIDQQITRRDDILSLDYITSEFDFSHAFFGSYEVPVVFPDLLKLKAYGSYGEYTAGELALSLQNVRGSQGLAGLEGIWSPLEFPGFDWGRLSFAPVYVDLSAGAKWQGIEVDNRTFGVRGETDLLLPYAGVNFSSLSQKTKLGAGLQLEGNLAGLAGTDKDNLAPMGRLDTDDEWLTLKWGGGFSFFLEPMLTPKSDRLAHEVALSSRGQFVFGGQRLIPQQEELIGGFYSVRGYPEVLDAADTVYVGSLEYRWYVARSIKPIEKRNVAIGSKTSSRNQFANPFRFTPKDIFGRPKWEFILRAFLDGGQSFNNHRRPSETDRNLLGTGAGLEIQMGRNLNVRVDYGIALLAERQNLRDPVDAGDNRVHFSATLAW